jgi:RNA polymerase sigma-70 factor (ECF subfamily)
MGSPPERTVKISTDERVMVRGMLAGDESAFERFTDGYIPALHRFASFRLDHDRELTREIVQSTLVKAIAKLSSFRGEASLLTWLRACCKTEIATHFRRGKSRPSEVELTDDQAVKASPLNRTPPDGPERSVLRGETAVLVHAALDLLPPHYGRILEWKYLDSLPVKEIADRMKLKPKAAESLLTRARNSFREIYAGLQVGPSHETE